MDCAGRGSDAKNLSRISSNFELIDDGGGAKQPVCG
jgi:hypothetical protein